MVWACPGGGSEMLQLLQVKSYEIMIVQDKMLELNSSIYEIILLQCNHIKE